MVNLRELREKHSLTQQMLAELVGVSDNMISKYERGVDYPSMEIAIKIADHFKTSIDYLLGRSMEGGI